MERFRLFLLFIFLLSSFHEMNVFRSGDVLIGTGHRKIAARKPNFLAKHWFSFFLLFIYSFFFFFLILLIFLFISNLLFTGESLYFLVGLEENCQHNISQFHQFLDIIKDHKENIDTSLIQWFIVTVCS